ncbi:hypothetical protein ACA910_008730 [Epithemia clementina (nom. ined.)]
MSSDSADNNNNESREKQKIMADGSFHDHASSSSSTCPLASSPLQEVYYHLIYERSICNAEGMTVGHIIDSLREEGLYFWRDARFQESRDVAWQMATMEQGLLQQQSTNSGISTIITEADKAIVRKVKLNCRDFVRLISSEALLIMAAFSEELVIPDWKSFTADMIYHYDKTKPITDGENAQYIPILKEADPNKWGVAFCSVDGQRFSIGGKDARETTFSLQSVSKPITYALCLQAEGEEEVDKWISLEPAGRPFNTQDLEVGTNRPFNASVNSGAIMAAGLFASRFPKATWMDCVNKIRKTWYELCGQDLEIGFSQETFESEKATAFNNIAISYNLKGRRGLPRDVNIEKMLDIYLGCCSIEMTTEALATAAATFANGGVCPITRQVVFPAHVVRHVLAETMTCGMYDQAGRFAVQVGVPAKSGVSGALMVIVPNVLGIATFSPRLNANGNSVRGLAFCEALVRSYRVHLFEPLRSGNDSAKIDPRKNGTRKVRADLSQYALGIRVGDSWSKQLREIFLWAMVHVAFATEEGLSSRMRAAIQQEHKLVYQVPLDDPSLQRIIEEVQKDPTDLSQLEKMRKGRLIHDDFRSVIAFALMEIIHVDGKKTERENEMALNVITFLGVDPEVARMKLDRYEHHIGPNFKESEPFESGQLLRLRQQSGSVDDIEGFPTSPTPLYLEPSSSSGSELPPPMPQPESKARDAEQSRTSKNKNDTNSNSDQEVLRLRREVYRLRRQVATLNQLLHEKTGASTAATNTASPTSLPSPRSQLMRLSIHKPQA